jgi:hypothetical protein
LRPNSDFQHRNENKQEEDFEKTKTKKKKKEQRQHLQQSESSVESLTFRSRFLFTTSAMIRAVENDSQRR